MYEVILEEGWVHIRRPKLSKTPDDLPGLDQTLPVEQDGESIQHELDRNEFFLKDIPPGTVGMVEYGSHRVSVYKIDGSYNATAEECTHAGAPLSEGTLHGNERVCPWHDSCFNVTSGAGTCPLTQDHFKIY